MFERNYDTAAPAVLDADQSAVVRREVRSMLSALGYLAESLAPGKPVERQLIHSVLYASEARLAQLGTITGVETNSATDREQRHLALRTANQRIRELEREIGGAVSAEQTKQAVTHLLRKVNRWWREQGLGLVREASIDSWGGLSVTLSCTLFGTTALTNSNTPVSDEATRRAWLKSLEEQGFVLAEGQGNVGHLAACDASRETLVRLIKGTFPSAQFQGVQTRVGRREKPVITDFRFYVPNLEDVAALPDATDEMDA